MTLNTSYISFPSTRSAIARVLLAGTFVALLVAPGAHASLIVSVQSATAAVGSSGNGFDVQLTNSGPADLTIAGFTFGILTANVDISFTDANISTSVPYIFAGNSLFGPDLTGPTSGQSLSTSDVFVTPFAGITLIAGTTVGLGHILFDVSSSASAGVSPVNLVAFPLTSLSDPAGGDVAIQTLTPGEITITGVGVPEPVTMSTLLAGIALMLGRAAKRRR